MSFTARSLPPSSTHPYLPPQIFSIFFSNLTTTITEVEIYLCANPTLRDDVPKDLVIFKKMFDKVSASIVTAKKKLRTDKNFNLKEDEHDEAYTKALSGQLEPTPDGKLTDAEKMIRSLNWNNIQYYHQWTMNHALMSLKSFKRSNRTAQRRGERLLVMSGQSWNSNSQNTTRDWSNLVAAVTLETALVESYRFDLLKACPGACALRKGIQSYFLSIATPYHKKHPTTGATERVLEWDFPDGIPLTVHSPGNQSYDPDKLKNKLDVVNPTRPSKAKHDTVRKTINSLEKNKLLWSSDPEAPYGTVETLAHLCIVILAQVTRPSAARVPFPRPLTPSRSQIMYFNSVRMEHKKDKDKNSEPFDGEDFVTPRYEHKPHAKSVAFAKQVSTRACFPTFI